MSAHSIEFCRGIAKVIQGESEKAASYVKHGVSLGTLREKIITRLLRDNTPGAWDVETGFVLDGKTQEVSRQCDVLVHDSSGVAPYYRWENFVVVDSQQAKSVIEVKSELDKETFKDILNVYSSIVALRESREKIPFLAYALSGLTAQTLAEHVSAAVQANEMNYEAKGRIMNVPACLAVQNRNYVAIRPSGRIDPKLDLNWCVFDFSGLPEGQQPVDGIETGYFVWLYGLLAKRPAEYTTARNVYNGFNGMEVPDNSKIWVDSSGEIHQGPIPLQ